jgi:DNA-binding XRE family transcriptional regulator
MARPRKFFASPIPNWACRIKALRQKLQLSQHQLARILGCSPTAVSRWERGLQKPPADGLIHMGKMVGRSSGWYFWKMAGIGPGDAMRMLKACL